MKVYIADVKPLLAPEKFEAAYKTVDEKRKEKIDRFLFRKDKLLSLGAALLLKRALSDEGIEDTETALLPGGKPYLKNCSGRFFSLSHSGTAVMCVLADVPVGCDIEEIKKPPLSIMKRFFSSEEQSFLAGLEQKAQSRGFYALWTAKESYLKMTGEGIKSIPNDFSVSIPFRSQPVRGRMVTFLDIDCEENYQASVCADGGPSDKKIHICRPML